MYVLFLMSDALSDLRFAVGARVRCQVSPQQWLAGRVVQHGYKEDDWPGHKWAAYQVKLLDGQLIYAPEDSGHFIRDGLTWLVSTWKSVSRRVRRRHSRPRLKCVEVRRHAIMPWLYRSSARSVWVQCEPKSVCRYARRSLVALSIGMRMGEASLMRSCLAVMAMPFILLPPLRELMAEHIELFVRCIVTHPGDRTIVMWSSVIIASACSTGPTDESSSSVHDLTVAKTRAIVAGSVEALVGALRLERDAKISDIVCAALCSLYREPANGFDSELAASLEAADALPVVEALPENTGKHRANLLAFLRSYATQQRRKREVQRVVGALEQRQHRELEEVVCSGCHQLLQASSYSNAQRKKPGGLQRCKGCVAGVQQPQISTPPPPPPELAIDACSACGKQQVQLFRCALCVELKLARTAKYCSTACQAKAWPEHKKSHKNTAELLASQAAILTMEQSDKQSLSDRLILCVVSKSSEYSELCEDALRHRHQANYSKASKLLQKAIQLEPQEPWAFYSMGYLRQSCGEERVAVEHFEQASKLCDALPCPTVDSRDLWVLAKTSVFNCWLRSSCDSRSDTVYPAWIFDIAAKRRISASCFELQPERFSSCRMRGEVLLEECNRAFRAIVDAGSSQVEINLLAVAPLLVKDVRQARQAFQQGGRVSCAASNNQWLDIIKDRLTVCDRMEAQLCKYL